MAGEPVIQYEVAYRWKRGEKTGWTTIGHAFANDDGSIRVSFNAAPVAGLAADPGEFRLYPKKEKVGK